MTGDFAPLVDVLGRYQDTGQIATLWWRDDDAAAPSPALDCLLALSARHDVPLALAVVPVKAEDGLGKALESAPAVAVLQHGYAHQNYAATGEKKIELGPQRPAQVIVGELATGSLRLEALFGRRALPVLVPPWNRLAPFLLPVLPELGYRGLSQFGPRARVTPVQQLRQVNCHVDPIDWRAGTGFIGPQKAVAALVAHLALRLQAGDGAAGSEPTGLMTHHAVHDEAMRRFLDGLLSLTRGHKAVRWLGAREVFGL
jgi:peptidoglycan/xylan/chitin deacetylase (PgdA/CDA1 family)